MKTYKISELVFDFSLFPRGQIDSQHAGYILRSLEAGATIPPIVIDKKSKRVIDGFHRARAVKNFRGDSAKIECVEKSYDSEAEMLADAIRYNASHGRSLTSFDRARCTSLAKNLGLSVEKLADALSMTVAAVQTLTVDRSAEFQKLTVPLKRTVRHFAGRNLTLRQHSANKRLSGMNQQFYANQLIELIESEMLDLADENLMTALRKLQDLLEKVLIAAH